MSVEEWGKAEFPGSERILIFHVGNFVDWIRETAYYGALKNIGYNLFRDKNALNGIQKMGMDETWELEATFFELNRVVIKENNKFYIETERVAVAGQSLSNHFVDKILFDLSYKGMIDLVWDKNKQDFAWKGLMI